MLRPDRQIEFVGDSPAIRTILDQAGRIAGSDSRVVILGESERARVPGSDAARRESPPGKPFMDLHCGAIPNEIQESELFGHERGAFTGAVSEKPGLFELADGGTLFLDEFAEMTPEMQTKLLKVLEAGEFRRVGGVRTITVSVRVLVATNQDPDELVRQDASAQSSLHRVDVIRLTLPPLRERPDDVPRFVEHFLELHRRRGLPSRTLAPDALRVLQSYPWPGNVRELANTIERLLILSPGPEIEADDLPENIRLGKVTPRIDGLLTLAEVERHIQQVLRSVGGHRPPRRGVLGSTGTH